MQGDTNDYGFRWGPVAVARLFCNDEEGWCTVGIITEKYKEPIQITVSKEGYVGIFDATGKWRTPRKKGKPPKKVEPTEGIEPPTNSLQN